MTFYIDASVIVPLFVEDRFTDAAMRWMDEQSTMLSAGRLVMTEVSSAISRLSRMGLLVEEQRIAALGASDEWFATNINPVEHLPADLTNAMILVRHPSPKLLSPDAIHLATARRLDLTLVTFDKGLAAVAALRDVQCVQPES